MGICLGNNQDNYTGSSGEKIPQKVLGGYFFGLTLYIINLTVSIQGVLVFLLKLGCN